MVDEDSFLLDDFSRLINYWIFLPLFVVLRGKSFFIRSSSILFYWIVGFLCFCGEKCAWLSKLSSSIPFFPKSFFMGSMRILFYEMVDIFCLWVEQNVFSYQSSLSSFFFYCGNLFLYGRRGFSPLGWHFVFERRKMYLVIGFSFPPFHL